HNLVAVEWVGRCHLREGEGALVGGIPANLLDADLQTFGVGEVPADELLCLLRVLGSSNHGDGRATPHGRDVAARRPLRHRGHGELATLMGGAALDYTLTPHSRGPRRNLTGIEACVPVVAEVAHGSDKMLVDKILPESRDLLGRVAVDGDLPGVAVNGE